MDGFFILLGLAALIGLLLGPIGFFLTLGARERLRDAQGQIVRLEARLKKLETGALPVAPREAPPQAAPVAAPEPAPVPQAAPGAIGLPGAPPAIAARAVADPAVTAPVSPPPRAPAPPAAPPRGFEEALGTRWTVWVGGIALALGALLLVRYSIDQGFFGPGARILMGLGLAAGLVAGGEWMRRNERGKAAQAAYIPGVLTAAGAVAAFAAIYAAYGVYGFIGPAAAFVLLGAAGVACMFAAALHGPALAGLGLVGSLATPLLVSTSEPNPWALMIYLAVVSAASYALARLRRWLWLALATAIGGGLWAFGFILSMNGGDSTGFFQAGALHVLIAGAMAAWFISVDPWRGSDPATSPVDPAAVLVPAGFAVIAQFLLFTGAQYGQFGTGWMAFAAAVTLLLAVTGLASAPAAAVTGVCGLFIAAVLRVWPGTFATDITWRLPDWSLTHWVEPVNAGGYGAFAVVTALGLAALCARALLAGRSAYAGACFFAGAATLTPLLALITAWLRFGKFETSYTFAALAAALGVAFVFAAQVFRGRLGALAGDARPQTLVLGLGAFASATFAALALAFTFALEGGTLTIALALAAAGAAHTAGRLEIPALRHCVTGLGIAVAARLAWDPRIVGAALGKTLIFNWLLAGYGIPALAFGYAARAMRRADGAEDTPARVAQALAVLLAGFLVFFEIRHALNDGDIYAPASGFVEIGLLVFSGFGFAAVLTRLEAARRSPVFRAASYIGFVGTMILAVLGLGFAVNPLFTHRLVEGGALFNTLIPGYGLPAAAAFILARVAAGARPFWYVTAARIAAIALIFGYLTLALRRMFRGADIYWERGAGPGESYAYSALWLAFGLVLLAYGLWRGSKEARLASAFFVFLTVVKVFVFDLAGLTGLWRPLSFIGLGLVLMGIGLVYQKLVFAKPRAAPGADAPVV